MKKEQEIKEDHTVSTYVKPIQATPTLTGDDAANIIKQILTASPTDQSPFTIIP